MPFPVRSLELIEAIRIAYANYAMPLRTIEVLFTLGAGELHTLVRRHRWPARSASTMTPSERLATIRAAEAAHQVELYGDAVDDVRLLRQRGFVVTREGQRCRVGNTLCSLAELQAKAARERRLRWAGGPPLAEPRQSELQIHSSEDLPTCRLGKPLA